MVFGSYVYEAPLLPYEKQLIALIGSTEEEYRQFVGEVIRRNRIRPAGYEHIPDIVGGPPSVYVPILISLAIGLVSTGISMLLAPKPIAPGSGPTRRDLDSITGGNRFTPSRAFDTAAELADYNAAIPIVFGLYNEVERVGGLLVSPRLVWSRMLSHGRQQSAKLMFVVGEQGKADFVGPDGIRPPSLNGIFVGNNALDAIYSSNFAFYWKRNTTASGFSRIQNINRVYGTGGTPESADPNAGRHAADDDVFLCPTRKTDFEKGFCHSYTPSNNTTFGVHSPIANGNAYRVNWRVVSKLSDPDGRLDAERKKISGNDDMDGTGRNYSRRMGIISLNGNTTSEELFEVVNVQVGDIAVFKISDTSIPTSYLDDKVTADDINSEIESQQIAADDAMEIGELFSIGSTVWQVVKRNLQQYISGDGKDQEIELKCIETENAYESVIGIVNESSVVNPGDHINDSGEGTFTVGEGFFPITKIARGSIRNSRACDVTEVGLKSVVFQRLNGITNFMSLPTAGQLKDFDDDDVQITSGTISSHVNRSSIFTIYVRRAGLDNNGQEFSYQRIALDFVVTGNKPVPQYNFIRIHHPKDNIPIEYEYKFVPRSGADLRSRDDGSTYVQLQAASSSENPTFAEYIKVPSYGEFKIVTTGRIVDKATIRTNKEFVNKPSVTNSIRTFGFPSVIGIDTFLPDDQPEETTFLRAVDDQERRDGNTAKLVSDPTNAVGGKMGAFGYEAFGDPDDSTIAVGERKEFETTEFIGERLWVKLKFLVEKFALPEGHFARASGQQHTWLIGDYSRGLTIQVVDSSPGWNSLSRFVIKRGLGSTAARTPSSSPYQSSNPFQANGLRMSGYELVATGVESTVEVKGRSQGYFEEVFGNASTKNIGDRATHVVDKSIDDGDKTIRMTLRSQVVSASNHWSGRTQLWAHPTIEIEANESVTTKNWNVGDTFQDTVEVDEFNIFASHYYDDEPAPETIEGQVGIRFSIQAVAEEIVSLETLTGNRTFLNQSQYSDISLYGDLVQKSNESEPEHALVYVNEMVENDPIPNYNKLTTSGLVLRASSAFTRLDQLRVWVGGGVQVKRLHPDVSTYNDSVNTTAEGPSNLFTDLVFYLLTNYTAGAGSLLNMSADSPNLINVTDLETTSRFLRANKLFCNGAITEKVNIREFISSSAPNFLCNFVLSNGKFSLRPAVPTDAAGEISTEPVQVKQIFTSGNILEDTFELEFLGAEERRNFTALIRYRYERQNKLPEERTLSVKLATGNNAIPAIPVETFDLTQFCTSRHHAFMVGKYFLALRKLVTHTVTFSTTIDGLDLGPGDFIKVITEASPYTPASLGTVSSTGVITSASTIEDGTYSVTYYTTTSEDIESGEMQVSDGSVTDSTFYNSIFTISRSSTSENIYLVEQLTFEEDMTIRIVASEYPCDSAQASELAKLVVDDAAFTAQGPS